MQSLSPVKSITWHDKTNINLHIHIISLQNSQNTYYYHQSRQDTKFNKKITFLRVLASCKPF